MLAYLPLLVLILTLNWIEAIAPGITGVSCTTVQDRVYVFGGAKATKESNPNTRVYSLDLKTVNTLTAYPFWTDTGFDLNRPALYSTALTVPSQNKDDGRVLVVGGKNVKLTDGLTQISIKGSTTLSANNLNKPTNLTDFTNSNNQVQFYPYGGGFVQNDLNPDEFLFFGGYFLANDQASIKFNPFNLKYSLNKDSWSTVNVTSPIEAPPLYYSTAHSYKGNLYVIGGASSTTNIAQPLGKVYRFSFKDSSWDLLDAGGDNVGNRYSHSSVIIGNKIYVVGGTNGNLVNGVTAVLDLDQMKWTYFKTPNLEAKSQGCLVSYQDKLVYGFGFSTNFDSVVQTIDISNSSSFKVLQYSGPKEPMRLSTLLGAAIGAPLGFIFLVAMAYLLYVRYKKVKAAREEYLKQYEAHLKSHNEIFNTDASNLSPTNPTNSEKTGFDTGLELGLHTNSNLFRSESEYLDDNGFNTNPANIDNGVYDPNADSNKYGSVDSDRSNDANKKDLESTLVNHNSNLSKTDENSKN